MYQHIDSKKGSCILWGDELLVLLFHCCQAIFERNQTNQDITTQFQPTLLQQAKMLRSKFIWLFNEVTYEKAVIIMGRGNHSLFGKTPTFGKLLMSYVTRTYPNWLCTNSTDANWTYANSTYANSIYANSTYASLLCANASHECLKSRTVPESLSSSENRRIYQLLIPGWFWTSTQGFCPSHWKAGTFNH